MRFSLLIGYGPEKLNELLPKVSAIEKLDELIKEELKNNKDASNPFAEVALILLDKILTKEGKVDMKVVDDCRPMKYMWKLKVDVWQKFIDDFARQIKNICISKQWIKDVNENIQVEDNHYQYCLPSCRGFDISNPPKKKAEKPLKQKRKASSSSAALVQELNNKQVKKHKPFSDPLKNIPLFNDLYFNMYTTNGAASASGGCVQVNNILIENDVALTTSATPPVVMEAMANVNSDEEINFFVSSHELFLPTDRLKNMIMSYLTDGSKNRKKIVYKAVKDICLENQLVGFLLLNKDTISKQTQQALKDFKARISGILGYMRKEDAIIYNDKLYKIDAEMEWSIIYFRYYEKDKAEQIKSTLSAVNDIYIESLIKKITINETNTHNYRYLVSKIKEEAFNIIEDNLNVVAVKPAERCANVQYVPFTEVIKDFVIRVAKKYFAIHHLFNQKPSNEHNQNLSNNNNANNLEQLMTLAEEAIEPSVEEGEIDMSAFQPDSPMVLEFERRHRETLWSLQNLDYDGAESSPGNKFS